MEFFFTRHGQTDYNAARRYQGWLDIPLNETGRAQARVAHEILKDTVIDIAYISTLSRAMETADIVLEKRQAVQRIDTDKIWERGFGGLEGEEAAFVKSHYWPRTVIFRNLPETQAQHQPERQGTFLSRVEEILKLMLEHAEDGKTALMVAHGGVYACIHRLLDIADITPPHNAAVYKFRYTERSGWQCEQLAAAQSPGV